MATITTDTFLDGGTARTAGESWTLNGATLTVRTDTRWHANAPASMTGTLGAITGSNSLGATLKFDGTQVRWMPYDAGSGNVPAIGTTITQGGVSGYLLGVWADYTSAPTAVGAAMPATGYIKFREVTGGTYSAGALTGIGASATGPDVVGWIEVVLDTGATWTFYRGGHGIIFDGSWFEIGTTNGSIGQTMQVPTNGGGANTSVVAVQVETSPGSGQYEWYGCASTTSGWTTTNFTTDTRAKVVQTVGGGQIRFGSNGTNNIGYVPASGCKVRVPNIFGRHASPASRATNAAPPTSLSTIGSSMTTGGAKLKIYNLMSDSWQLQPDGASSIEINNSALSYMLSNNPGAVSIVNSCFSKTVAHTAYNIGILYCPSVNISSNYFLKFTGNSSAYNGVGTAAYLSGCSNITISANKLSVSSKSNNGNALILISCINATIDSNKTLGYGITVERCTDIAISNSDYTDSTAGATTASTSYVFTCTYSKNVTYSDMTIGNSNEYSNSHPQQAFFYTAGNIGNIRIKNVGTYASPLTVGATNRTQYLNIAWGFNDTDVKFSRIYLSNIATMTWASASGFSASNISYENVYINSGPTSTIYLGGVSVKGSRLNTGNAGINYSGTHIADEFYSATNGRIKCLFAAPSTSTAGQWEVVVNDNSVAGFTGYGDIALKDAGDYAIYTMNYFAIGHTGFSGTASIGTRLSSTNMVATFQYDIGGGWNGAWLTAAQMASVIPDPAFGVKLKFKIELTIGGTVRTANSITLYTTTTNGGSANLYPLSTASLGFTGLQPGSEVRVYAGTDPATSVEIGGIESTSGSTFSFSHSYGGTDGYIMIFALGYQPIYIPYTFKSVDDSILIQQVIDRNYTNPA